GTNATATGLTAGTYTVTVTDFNGCQTTRAFTINQPAAALGATISKTDVSCNGGGNGTATVAVTGGTTSYTYSWAPSGGNNATATGLSAGTYTVTVTDANACQITRTVTVNQPAAALGATISKTDVSCNGGGNGTATVAVTGGTTSYTYSWAPSGGNNATATGLSAGTYTVTIMDANACQITRTVTVNQPAAALSLAYGGSSSITKDAAFSYTFAATGGTPGYTYSTTGTRPNGLNLSNSGVLSGTPTATGTFIFNVIATDVNSCTRSIPVSITVADPLPVTLTGFTTKPVSGGVEVSWNTVSETNSSHFELMHATENGKFSLISRQEAMGNSGTGKRYSFLHRQPANGNNYYQLLQLDKNGDSKDYGVKTVYFTSVTKDGVSLYPNPAAHTVTVTFATKTYSQLQVTDMLGKVVRSQKIGSADTEQRISVETLPTGTYTIILTAEGKRSVHKLIKL
ncbi:T9SS type A sorting domain-containing protein, partial [Pedobacter chitinilyticus]